MTPVLAIPEEKAEPTEECDNFECGIFATAADGDDDEEDDEEEGQE